MTGKIKEIIDTIILKRSKGNPAIAEMTKAKFILKGVNPNKFDKYSTDDPIIIEKLRIIAKQLNFKELECERSNIESVYSTKSIEKEVVADIENQLNGFGAKLIIFFASSSFDQNKLCNQMQKVFKDCIVFGCSTAGEIASGKLLKNSVVAMAFNSNIILDAKVEVLEQINENLSVEAAFTSFERYFNESSYTMDTTRYVGIALIDGVSMKEEKLMDQIGNRTNVYFIEGSAGDDLKFVKTFVCANGKAYSNSAVIVLLKMSANAEFDIINTQSFKALDHVLIANKVNEVTREVIEFNNMPAITAYANAVGAFSVEEASKYFPTHPVGLVIGENDIFVRSPRQKKGTNIEFNCNIIQGSEVRLLQSTNIVEDTKNLLDKKINEFGRIEGIVNFDCINRTLELEKKNLVKQYGEIFSDIPTIGFSTYGEGHIGFTNQTSTMLVFKNNVFKQSNYKEEAYTCIHPEHRLIKQNNIKLIKENIDLRKQLIERNQQLEETTAALKQFNTTLEEEINERTKREEEICYLSYHDKLTGLYNRRFYEIELKRLDTERNLPISIIMGDVNSLKLVNDAFGHLKGDELLQKAAAAIQSACRNDDIVSRWGGDEFVILLPKTKTEEVIEIIDRIKVLYSKERISTLSFTISFGWDTKIKTDENILKVLKNAEDHMYKRKVIESDGMRDNIINTIANTLHEKNPREEQHSKRVSEICQEIGKAINFPEIEIRKLKAAGLLHDIGKIAIEEKILNKPGKLTVQERNEINRHPDIGYRILSSSNNMLELANYILAHHERWDGTGYPKGLKGEAIPLMARIIALADSYDAMTSVRLYRNALSEEEALIEILKNAGTQFDPELTKIFVEKVLNKS
ncbi:diguanylate cyclase [Clostridium algoriphilum]|uniref:HD domain-containing phosphohydrolase n=1 Tax=Clostridium algoriphilum TaxID=198347 RepID=UPI001CF5B356|nr:HD domain-containing phosphohydrolase [Clostridium algoriphilum]MCB2292731.1 diguanylate cyclase [Clostridium algoriphilum]